MPNVKQSLVPNRHTSNHLSTPFTFIHEYTTDESDYLVECAHTRVILELRLGKQYEDVHPEINSKKVVDEYYSDLADGCWKALLCCLLELMSMYPDNQAQTVSIFVNEEHIHSVQVLQDKLYEISHTYKNKNA